MTDIVHEIEMMLKKKGWTRYRLSRESGLTTSTVYEIVAGHRVPGADTLQTIAKALGARWKLTTKGDEKPCDK